ncbi:hypothetical protein LINGRAHAP2_LOCUS23918, partial [Linum grandiflorum]
TILFRFFISSSYSAASLNLFSVNSDVASSIFHSSPLMLSLSIGCTDLHRGLNSVNLYTYTPHCFLFFLTANDLVSRFPLSRQISSHERGTIIVNLRTSSQADLNRAGHLVSSQAKSEKPHEIQELTVIAQRYSQRDPGHPQVQTASPVQYCSQTGKKCTVGFILTL